MSGFLCSMVGATFSVAAVGTIIRSKKGITAVGNAQVDTAQSKFGGASALFDGTGDWLTTGSQSDLNFGTNDFTIEFWIRPSALNNDTMVIGSGVGSWGSGALGIAGGTSSYGMRFFSYDYNSSGSGLVKDPSAMTTNTWHHYALVRSGNNWTLYRDGTSVSTATWSGSVNFNGNSNTYIGYAGWGGVAMNGWLDEFRISKTARYTSNFTAPTAPFTNDDNTVLLIHADGADASTFFEDDNGTRQATSLISNGPSISTTQSKFGGTSAYFPGTSGYELVARNWNSTGITSAFTFECWVYITDKTTESSARIWNNGLTSSTYDYRGIQFNYATGDGNANKILAVFGDSSNNSWSGTIGVSYTFSTNTWYHIAVSRDSSNNVRIFVNGTLQGSSWSNSLAWCANSTDDSFIMGRYPGTNASRLRGYIDEVRISKICRYNTNFTAPTAPFTNDSDTNFLMHSDGTNGLTVFRDDNGSGRSAVGLTPNSSAQISTAQSKFGGSSALFARSAPNDWVKTSDTSEFCIENYTSWTIEFWLRFANNQSDNFPLSTSDDKFNMRIQSGGSCNFNTQGSSPSWTKTHTVGTWYHYAIVKTSDGTVTVYLDGVSQGTGNIGGSTPSSRSFYFGDRFDTGYCMDGYMDEIRISKTARYTTTFTPATAPFTNDANTVLLIHCDGTNGSTVFIDDNGIADHTA